MEDFRKLVKTLGSDLRKLEESKQELVQHPDYDSECLFARLTTKGKNYISEQDITNFLTSNNSTIKDSIISQLMNSFNVERKIFAKDFKLFLNPEFPVQPQRQETITVSFELNHLLYIVFQRKIEQLLNLEFNRSASRAFCPLIISITGQNICYQYEFKELFHISCIECELIYTFLGASSFIDQSHIDRLHGNYRDIPNSNPDPDQPLEKALCELCLRKDFNLIDCFRFFTKSSRISPGDLQSALSKLNLEISSESQKSFLSQFLHNLDFRSFSGLLTPSQQDFQALLKSRRGSQHFKGFTFTTQGLLKTVFLTLLSK